MIRDSARSGSIDRAQFARLRAAERCRHSDCKEWSVLSPDPYMASYVKRAYVPCPVYFLAFLTLPPWTRE